MSKLYCLIVCIIAVYLTNVYAFSPEVRQIIRKNVLPLVKNCSETHGVSQEEIKAAQATGREVQDLKPCFLGCVLKITGVLSYDGVYNTYTALDLLKDLLSAEEFPVYQEKARKCGYVNDQTYYDGNGGCAIAKAILLCYRVNDIDIILS